MIDSGLLVDSPEFAGRISPASANLFNPSGGIADQVGHGTGVAGVLVANRNGDGIMGVAFESSVMMLLSRSGPENLARTIDYARTNGARALNMAFWSDVTPEVAAAAQRASDAGMVVVISAGNTGADNPNDFARDMAAVAGGTTIIAGAHDLDRQMTTWSARAGDAAQNYLVALGMPASLDLEGNVRPRHGTSFSAPIIVGAVALLADLWPHLSGQQITEILFTSADDMGDPGVDPIWGHGILNIRKAVQPAGQMNFAGLAVPVSGSDSSRLSSAMGDAGAGLGSVVVLDQYERDYAFNLGRTLGRPADEQPLHRALDGDHRAMSSSFGGAEVSMTISLNPYSQAHRGLAQAGLGPQDEQHVRARSGFAIGRIAPNISLGFGISESGRALQQRMARERGSAFLVSGDPLAQHGFYPRNQQSIGARHLFGATAVSVTAERGEVQEPRMETMASDRPRYTLGAITAYRRLGPARASIGLSQLEEEHTVLGGRFSDWFVRGGATSHFVDVAADLELGREWTVRASYRRGRTSVSGSAALAAGGRFESDAWAFDVVRGNALAAGDLLALRVSQPMRVQAGGLDLILPVSYDHAAGETQFDRRVFSLAPSGRQIDIEGSYSIALLGGRGYLGAHTYLRRHPGHVETGRSDTGAAFRFGLRF